MNKAFTRELDREDDEDEGESESAVLPQGAKNYITAAGYRRLRTELMTLLDDERPKVVETVSWAAAAALLAARHGEVRRRSRMGCAWCPRSVTPGSLRGLDDLSVSHDKPHRHGAGLGT